MGFSELVFQTEFQAALLLVPQDLSVTFLGLSLFSVNLLPPRLFRDV